MSSGRMHACKEKAHARRECQQHRNSFSMIVVVAGAGLQHLCDKALKSFQVTPQRAWADSSSRHWWFLSVDPLGRPVDFADGVVESAPLGDWGKRTSKCSSYGRMWDHWLRHVSLVWAAWS